MAAHRVPLSNVPDAINSPLRPTVTTQIKRPRIQTEDARDQPQGQPPLKRQILDLSNDENGQFIDPRRRDGHALVLHDKFDSFPQRSKNAPPTSLERRFAAARKESFSKPTTSAIIQENRVDKVQKAVDDNAESVRQWRRHYRRQFPTFVLYFDGVPEDQRSKALRQIQSLGAREEKFFSKAVTHVVTTRSIPSERVANVEMGKVESRSASSVQSDQRKVTNLLDATLQRRGLVQPQDTNTKLVLSSYTTDILTKARELEIKIWALEKLQRILRTLLEPDAAEQAETSQNAGVGRLGTRPGKDADLAQLLRNEKINGPADRDKTAMKQDMVTFRGYYIYIHDMDEATKPVMARDYAKPQTKEQGKWPQLRLTQPGRCPFIEDTAWTARLHQQEANNEKQKDSREDEKTQQTATLRRSPRKQDSVKPLDPPNSIPVKRQSSNEGAAPLFGSMQQGLRQPSRFIRGEPVASGVQASSITSAIRSQVISSTAISSTAPGMGRRIGDSKEVSALKRKVLERGASIPSNQSMPSSYMNDVRGAINGDTDSAARQPPRAAKRKAQETLGVVYEDGETKSRKVTVQKKRQEAEREAKPGYCENCRDKFDDFEEHINSRKHRKFALTQSNWTELDCLLEKLRRHDEEDVPSIQRFEHGSDECVGDSKRFEGDAELVTGVC